MQEQKSVVYTIILGVCMLLCLLLLGKMLLGRSEIPVEPAAPEEGSTMEFHITEDDIASALTGVLPSAIEETAVQISKTGTISVTAAISRQALSDSGLAPGQLRTALLFLPEQCRLYGAWRAAVADGALRLDCCSLSLEGYTLPEQAAQALSDELTRQCGIRMEQEGFSPRSVQWQDGEVVLYA